MPTPLPRKGSISCSTPIAGRESRAPRCAVLANFSTTRASTQEKLRSVRPGPVGVAHLAIELLKSKAGVDVVHVPYRGAAPALVDVMAGQVNAMIADISIFIGQANSDKLRPLALAGDKRSPLMPDVPTTTEAGLPGYKVENWYRFVAPKDTPPEEQNFLNTALNVAVNDPDVIRSFNDLGAVTIGGTPAEFRDFALQEYARWGGIIRDAGIKIN